MASSVITVNRDTRPSYFPIFYGMWLTLRNMLETLFVKGRSATIEYPEQKRNISKRYRGVHLLTAREDGTPKCVACYMCATVCPAECIYIEAGERPEKKIEKYPTRFEIDLLRCVFCGFCVDACPEEAILMSRENDLVGTSRAELDHRPRKSDAPRQARRSGCRVPPGRSRRAPAGAHRGPRAPQVRARNRARHAQPPGDSEARPRSTRLFGLGLAASGRLQ